MLKYENIWAYRDANNRLKKSSYGFTIHHTRDSDSLTKFTLEPQALADAEHNLSHCLNVARDYDADLLVLHENRVQFLGHKIREGIMDAFASREWIHKYREWSGSSWMPDVYDDASTQADLYGIDMWRRCLATADTQGVYDVDSGERIKNRREIISAFWDRGFAAQRGRPLAVSKIRWSGNREELEDLTALADRYWTRKHKSDVAKKIVSAFNSINRYAAWPGAW